MQLINETTKKWVDAYINRPKTTLLIDSNGDSESGLQLARYIYLKLNSSTHVPMLQIDCGDKKSIGIDDVRSLQKSLQLKANNSSGYTRFIVINEAEKLTHEAQNSLLKLMEELPEKTILIAVSNGKETMLQTVVSRCFVIPVLPITENQATEYGLSAGISRGEIRKAFLLSEGHGTRFINILGSDNDTFVDMVESAKQFINKSVFDRQLYLQIISSSKSTVNFNEFLNALKLTAQTGMRFATTTESKKKWQSILQSILLTEKQLKNNVNEKLAMLSLSVSI